MYFNFNDVIIVEKLAAEAGTSIEIDEILMIDNDGVSTVGAPLIEGARVAAEVLEQKRAKKITVFKKKRRQNYRRTIGHRQELTVLRITDILDAGESKKPKKLNNLEIHKERKKIGKHSVFLVYLVLLLRATPLVR